MNRNPITDEELRSYLLDNLPQPARAQLEERYLSDDETYERLLAMEEELIDEHAHGLISSRQWEPLKRSLLLSKDGPERLRFAEAIEQLHLQKPQRSPSRLTAGLQLLNRRKAVIPTAVGAIALLIYLTVLPPGTHRQPTNRATDHTKLSPTQNQSHIEGPSSIVTLFLHSISRDQSAGNVLQISDRRESVRLEAELPGDEHNSYQATVRRVDGDQIQTPTHIQQRPTQPGTILLTATFAPDSFQDGDYILTIFTATANRPPEETMAYTFTVARTPAS